MPAPLRPISATRSPAVEREVDPAQDVAWPAAIVELRPQVGDLEGTTPRRLACGILRRKPRLRLRLRRAWAQTGPAGPHASTGTSSLAPATPADASTPWRGKLLRAAFTEVGGGRRPARSKSRAAGVASAPSLASAHWRKSPGSPSKAIRPSTRASTRSAAARQRSSRCSAQTTASPHSSFSRRNNPISSSPATGSSWEVGSSSSTRRGRPTSAAARATRWSSPPESVSAVRSSRCGIASASAASSTARARAAGGSPRISSGNASSPRTVVETTCVSGSWATRPTAPPSSAGPWSRTSRPPTSISPLTSPP